MSRLPFLVLIAVLISGCSTDPATDDGNNTAPDASNCGTQCADLGASNFRNRDADEPPGPIVSIRLEPDVVTLVAENGDQATQDFRVVGVREDGTTATVTGSTFEIDTDGLGFLDDSNGRFTANGVVGGTATVTATAMEAGLGTASAELTVQIEHRFIHPVVPPDAEERFENLEVNPALAPGVVYPLDGTVMPQNVFPADVQWLNGELDDVYRIILKKPHATVTALFRDTGPGFGRHWLVEYDMWRSLAQTDADDDVVLTVDRWVAEQSVAVQSPQVRFQFAKGALSGTVYYWDIGSGRIVSIDDGTGEGVDFMPSPPADENGSRCVGCHSVSNNGQYMVGRLGGGDNVGTVYDLTQDLSTDPPPSVFPVDFTNGARWWFSTWNPTDDRIAVTRNEPTGGLELMDPFTGASVPVQAGSLPTSNVTQPAWSPDGSLLAYVSSIDDWGGRMTTGEVSVIPVTGQDSFGTPEVIRAADIPGAVPEGSCNSYPTWSPDSANIAFAHGNGGRSDRDESALWMMDREGGNLVRLDNANGGPDTSDNYQPNFSPFDQGGYYWLMFLSRRDYGNELTGTRGSTRQQLWVTAISKDAAPGEDPSQVAYWLPGQNTRSMNIAGYWAPRPCRDDGAECNVGAECCGGTCAPDNGGTLVCSPPPPDRCRVELETCGSTADCCEVHELVCVDRVCQKIVN